MTIFIQRRTSDRQRDRWSKRWTDLGEIDRQRDGWIKGTKVGWADERTDAQESPSVRTGEHEELQEKSCNHFNLIT